MKICPAKIFESIRVFSRTPRSKNFIKCQLLQVNIETEAFMSSDKESTEKKKRFFHYGFRSIKKNINILIDSTIMFIDVQKFVQQCFKTSLKRGNFILQ